MALSVVGLALMGLIHLSAADLRVCYYTNWAIYRPEGAKYWPEDVDVNLCSHVIYAFASMEGNHLKAHDPDADEGTKNLYKRVTDLKEKNPDLKVLLAVGGWNFGTSRMTAMMASASNRKEFVDSSINYLRERNFDGLDLDFEYPGKSDRGSPAEDKQKFTLLCQELREGFEEEAMETGRGRLLLTAAVAAGKSTIDTGYEVDKISRELDFINIMTYDLHGAWEQVTGHNSPLHARPGEAWGAETLNVEYAAEYWYKLGCPKEKLVIGMPLYGRAFTLADPAKHGIGAPTSGPSPPGEYTREGGYLAYYEICGNVQSGRCTVVREADQEVPYCHMDSTWIGFDDQTSLQNKVTWLRQSGYGGWMVWALDLDDFKGDFCHNGRYPLLTALNEALLGEVPSQPQVDPEGSTGTDMPGVTPDQATQPPDMWTTIEPDNVIYPDTLPADDQGCSGKSDGLYPVPGDCEKFYHCSHEITHIQRCPSGTLFDPSTQICNWPDAVDCINPNQPEEQ